MIRSPSLSSCLRVSSLSRDGNGARAMQEVQGSGPFSALTRMQPVSRPGSGQGKRKVPKTGGSVKAGRPWRWSCARAIRHRQAPKTPLDDATHTANDFAFALGQGVNSLLRRAGSVQSRGGSSGPAGNAVVLLPRKEDRR